jgi:hypothetical protein
MDRKRFEWLADQEKTRVAEFAFLRSSAKRKLEKS